MSVFNRLRRQLNTYSKMLMPVLSARPPETHRIVRERLPISQPEPIGFELLDRTLQFWFDSREGSAPPDWSCFRPEKHPAMLPKVMLYEWAEGRFITRIIGDTIRPHLPPSSAGRPIEEVVAEDRVDDVKMRLERALSDGLPNYVEKQRLWQQGTNAYGYNALSMPFTSRSGPDRVLCIVDLNVEQLRR